MFRLFGCFGELFRPEITRAGQNLLRLKPSVSPTGVLHFDFESIARTHSQQPERALQGQSQLAQTASCRQAGRGKPVRLEGPVVFRVEPAVERTPRSLV